MLQLHKFFHHKLYYLLDPDFQLRKNMLSIQLRYEERYNSRGYSDDVLDELEERLNSIELGEGLEDRLTSIRRKLEVFLKEEQLVLNSPHSILRLSEKLRYIESNSGGTNDRGTYICNRCGGSFVSNNQKAFFYCEPCHIQQAKRIVIHLENEKDLST